MNEKLDELNNPEPKKYKDINSPESQEFLRKFQLEIREKNRQAREMLDQWIEEDKRNATK